MSEVFNAGYPGDTTRELLARFERDAASRLPDLVILWVGLNDMLYPGHTVEPEEFRRNYRRLVLRCRDLDAAVAAGTLTPRINAYLLENFPGVADFPETPDVRVERGETIIRELAAELELPLMEFGAAIRSRPVAEVPESYLRNQSNSGMHDGLHLTPAGCEAAARCAFQVIQSESLPHERVLCFGDSLTYGPWLSGRGTAHPDAQTYPGQLARLLNSSGTSN